ncbi:TRAP transporter small permease [Halomonas dongshanensis]|uniref:TRAP transporter small permease protein n=1 Tax=Halomonas dongshanensis TaxID=2890835 RepID=A0ABT2EC94_9GAMM|nr:TRAP transporter small permease [Halomonas dongshanensis]
MDEAKSPARGADRFAFLALRTITRFCDALGVALLIGVLGLIVAAVVARDLLGWGLPWSEEVVSLLAVYAVAFGAVSAWVRSDHLVVDLFSHRLGALGRQCQYRLTSAISMVFFVLAAWGAWIMSYMSAHNNTVSLGISFSFLYYAILFSFVAMALIALWQTLRGPVAWLDTPAEEAAP